MTAFLAASSRSLADTIASPDSSMIFLALSTLVPSSLTTRGICNSMDLQALTMNNFISGVDDIMRSRYVVEKVDEEEKDVYNMSTEIFIDKIDEIFTSTLKKDALDHMLKANNEAIAKVSVDRSYECGFCSKAFTSESKLMKHEICHTQFRCNTCGKGFRMQTLLTFHMNEHKVNSDEETLE